MSNVIKDIHQQMSASVTDKTIRNTVMPVVCSLALCWTHIQQSITGRFVKNRAVKWLSGKALEL